MIDPGDITSCKKSSTLVGEGSSLDVLPLHPANVASTQSSNNMGINRFVVIFPLLYQEISSCRTCRGKQQPTSVHSQPRENRRIEGIHAVAQPSDIRTSTAISLRNCAGLRGGDGIRGPEVAYWFVAAHRLMLLNGALVADFAPEPGFAYVDIIPPFTLLV
jgi:hypothetical protein